MPDLVSFFSHPKLSQNIFLSSIESPQSTKKWLIISSKKFKTNKLTTKNKYFPQKILLLE